MTTICFLAKFWHLFSFHSNQGIWVLMSIGFDVKALDRKKCGSAPTTSTTGPATSLDHETSESESSTDDEALVTKNLSLKMILLLIQICIQCLTFHFWIYGNIWPTCGLITGGRRRRKGSENRHKGKPGWMRRGQVYKHLWVWDLSGVGTLVALELQIFLLFIWDHCQITCARWAGWKLRREGWGWGRWQDLEWVAAKTRYKSLLYKTPYK